MTEASQSKGHPDSFEIETVCGDLEGRHLAPKKITLRTDMTLAQLENQFRGLFYNQFMYKLEVRWKGRKEPEEIGQENYSEILKELKQSGEDHKLVPYYNVFDPKGPSPIFQIDTVCGGERGEGLAPKKITLRTDMTMEDLREQFQGLFFPGDIYKLEVHWAVNDKQLIGRQDCSEILEDLKQSGKGRKLVPYYNHF